MVCRCAYVVIRIYLCQTNFPLHLLGWNLSFPSHPSQWRTLCCLPYTFTNVISRNVVTSVANVQEWDTAYDIRIISWNICCLCVCVYTRVTSSTSAYFFNTIKLDLFITELLYYALECRERQREISDRKGWNDKCKDIITSWRHSTLSLFVYWSSASEREFRLKL